jgi:predicted TIM-barrel fold metal-dependent hydrolase
MKSAVACVPRRRLAQTLPRAQPGPTAITDAPTTGGGRDGMAGVFITRVLHTTLLAWLLASAPVSGAPPLADVHVHYKWSQKEVTAAQQAIGILRDNDIALAVVIGTPAEYALELARLAPQTIIPIWSPYREPADWSSWPYDRKVLERARTALTGGEYRGIGELHLIGGFAPDWRTPVISGLLELAHQYRVPVLLHTELSKTGYVIELCSAYPEVRILWAHAGAILSATQVREVMATCPNLSAELSARDPWRFINNPITDSDGSLKPAWRNLIEAYPDRFMVGSDPVWPVEQLDSWDQADTGWQEYRRFIDFHRNWLEQLRPELAEKIRLGNARRLFAAPSQ